jgi:N-dimethylarginine dimethylaminohydrolase
MKAAYTSQSETGTLARLLLKHARDAFRNQDAARAGWQALHFTAEPEVARAIDEYERFVAMLRASGTEIAFLDEVDDTGLDSIYVRDASVVCDRGVILCRMGKRQRQGEPAAQEAAFRRMGVPVIGAIQSPGTLEGGDVAWLDGRTLAVGRGYRTNDEGITQLRRLLGDAIDRLIVVPLPHWRGPADVFHLMSILSPVDRDLAVVYSPLLPVPFREALLERGISLVEVPDEEFDSMGCNVLALGPRRCLVVRGNPITRTRLERAGCEVLEYDGPEISLKGGGGPTCLTRPIARLWGEERR